jgi:hypothetical protein
MTTVRTPDLSIKEHIEIAHAHTQRALDLAYGDEPQGYFIRTKIGRAQSILISLLIHNRFK